MEVIESGGGARAGWSVVPWATPRAVSVPGYADSKAFLRSIEGVVWNTASLDEHLTDTQVRTPGSAHILTYTPILKELPGGIDLILNNYRGLAEFENLQ